jgi:hypothetical protein
METPFRWASPLGISVILFLFTGFVHLAIGALTPMMVNRQIVKPMLIVSPRADRILFGQEPQTILETDATVFQLRTILINIIGGLLFALGVAEMFIAWFALRNAEPWSIILLGITGVATVLYWVNALSPYWRQGIRLGLGDLPPFMWVPAALFLPALILGCIGVFWQR